MKALVLVMLLSFTPSPQAARHDCWAWQRDVVLVPVVTPEGVLLMEQAMGVPQDVSCEVLWDRLTGDGWAVTGCEEAAALCAFCIWAESESGARSPCGVVDGYVEDL